jgi:hypothetical protein
MDYIAPEQAVDASKADPRADIYSLGCTLYFALAGRPPFPGGTPQDKIQWHQTQEPTPIERLRPELPAAFVDLLRKMMAKRPEDRFASAHEVRQELLRWASGEPIGPMDKQGDMAYREAVAALEAAEASSDLMGPVANPPVEEPSPVIVAGRAEAFATDREWIWSLWAALVLATVVLVVLVVILFAH